MFGEGPVKSAEGLLLVVRFDYHRGLPKPTLRIVALGNRHSITILWVNFIVSRMSSTNK